MTDWRLPAWQLHLPSARLSPLRALLLAALGMLVAAMAAFAAYALLAPDDTAPRSAALDWKAPLPAVVEIGEPKSASADVQTLSRPVFSKSRKPAPPTANATPSASETRLEDAPIGVTVSAIVKHHGESRAFVLYGGAPQGEWKKIGDQIDQWTIADIAATNVTVKNAAASARIELYPGKPIRDPSPATPPAMPMPAPSPAPPPQDPRAAIPPNAQVSPDPAMPMEPAMPPGAYPVAPTPPPQR